MNGVRHIRFGPPLASRPNKTELVPLCRTPGSRASRAMNEKILTGVF